MYFFYVLFMFPQEGTVMVKHYIMVKCNLIPYILSVLYIRKHSGSHTSQHILLPHQYAKCVSETHIHTSAQKS